MLKEITGACIVQVRDKDGGGSQIWAATPSAATELAEKINSTTHLTGETATRLPECGDAELDKAERAELGTLWGAAPERIRTPGTLWFL